jgi:hypothetical protein
MENPKRSPWITVLIIGVVLIFLCICALIIGGGAAYFFMQSGESIPGKFEINLGNKEEEQPVPTQPVVQEVNPTREEAQPTEEVEIKPTTAKPTPRKATAVKTPTKAAVLEEPAVEPPVEEPAEQADSSSSSAGTQERSKNRIFDDFSSDSMGWAIDKDEYVDLKIINGAYSIHNLTPDDMEWAYFPVDFRPYEIKFDVRGPSGNQDGTFGVMCQYIDKENYYYIEFDLSNNTYTIAELINDKIIALTKENSSGQYWYQAKTMKSPPTSTNNIAVSCYPDNITLFVNNTLVDQVDVTTPIKKDGKGAFFVYTYDFADENGYQVFFDNVEIFQPVQ